MVQNALADYSEFIDDWFDPIHLKKRDIPELRRSYEWIHQPENLDHWSKARRRFAYDELFFMQMGFLLSRQIRKEQSTSVRFSRTSEIDDHIRKRFPFSLTNAQNKVIEEVIADMNSNQPMYRLVQGDVGCGKTVVAVYAALVAVANKRQVAIMAPTEILAEQHYKKISRYLENSRVNVRLLTGGISSADKKNILENSAKGTIDILIGTHAIIQKNVEFARLGLVIIDEQHKFGVAQRFAIKSKGVHPHYLVMTATPIPRTMAMTIFGDLEISIIDSLPPGRIPPITRAYTYQKRNEIWEFVRKILSGGDQGFVVYPLLDPSDSLELNSAREEEKILSEKIFPEFRVALIHGKMKSDEKIKIMSDFAAKKINLLVATVVIEVGIDIPDAAVLVIEHGERFGLSQLHQLRGRIGRGGQQGYCLVLTDPKTEEARKRIRVFTSTCDGFKIAEEDLRIRGPGEFFGTAQHGLTELKVTDLIEDYPLLVQAKRDVETILKEDPALTWQKNRKLRMELKKRLGDKLKLIEAA
jgi:ATP-dependent DNA helicase RecG